MRCTVVWTPAALAQLAELWTRARDRNAVTRASYLIDQLLRVDPDLQGVPFFGDRFLVVPPLRVLFSINPMDMLVEVHTVW